MCLQFYSDSFESLQMSLPCFLDMHVLRLFLSLFWQCELSHFSGILTMKVNGQWIVCVPTVLF